MIVRLGLTVGLALSVFAFALVVVASTYEHRRQVSVLRELADNHASLRSDHDRLQLDRAAWATPTRIESMARSQLDMIVATNREPSR